MGVRAKWGLEGTTSVSGLSSRGCSEGRYGDLREAGTRVTHWSIQVQMYPISKLRTKQALVWKGRPSRRPPLTC